MKWGVKMKSRWPRLSLVLVFSVFSLCFALPLKSNSAQSKIPYLRNEMSTEKLKLFKETVARQAKNYPDYFFLEALNFKKEIALTFDDGPDATFTAQVLDVLKEQHVKATFFLVGSRLSVYPDVAKRVLAEGHAVGMHGFEHLDMRTISTIYAYDSQILRAQRTFKSVLGIEPHYFRPPFGAVNDEEIAYFGERGFKTINWSIDSFDWDMTQNSVDEITGRVLRYAHEGAIILMHTGGVDKSNTVKSLSVIIKALREQGYTFKNVPEMLGIPK